MNDQNDHPVNWNIFVLYPKNCNYSNRTYKVNIFLYFHTIKEQEQARCIPWKKLS